MSDEKDKGSRRLECALAVIMGTSDAAFARSVNIRTFITMALSRYQTLGG